MLEKLKGQRVRSCACESPARDGQVEPLSMRWAAPIAVLRNLLVIAAAVSADPRG